MTKALSHYVAIIIFRLHLCGRRIDYVVCNVDYIPQVLDNQQIEGNFATDTLTISKAGFQNVSTI